MRPRVTASRSAAALLLAALLVAGGGLSAPQAVAQSGNGLYEPFPEAAVKKRAQRYVEGLRGRTAEPGRRYSDAQLAAGAFVDAGPDAPALAPAGSGRGPGRADLATARAGVGEGSANETAGRDKLALPWQLLLISIALSAPAAALLKRARTSAA